MLANRVCYHFSACLYFSQRLRLRFSVSGAVSCNSNEIRGFCWDIFPDSLHITWLTLLSLWWYNPTAHQQTWAHLNARWLSCMRTHPRTNINLLAGLKVSELKMSLIFSPVACLEFSLQTKLDLALFCSSPPSPPPTNPQPQGTLQLNFTLASCWNVLIQFALFKEAEACSLRKV